MQRQHERTDRRKKQDLDLDPRHKPANTKAMQSKEFMLLMMNAFNAQGLANTSRVKAGHSDASLFGALEEAAKLKLREFTGMTLETERS